MSTTPTPDFKASMHPTKVKLLDTVVEMLDVLQPDEINVAIIVETSGVSHGSLYHHYEDLDDLVEQAIAKRYRRGLESSVNDGKAFLDGATSETDFRVRLEHLLYELHRPDRRANRAERVQSIGAIGGHPRLRRLIAADQQALTDAAAELLRVPLERGWIRPEVDTTAFLVFTQALLTGRIVDDVSAQHIDPELWTSMAVRASFALLFDE